MGLCITSSHAWVFSLLREPEKVAKVTEGGSRVGREFNAIIWEASCPCAPKHHRIYFDPAFPASFKESEKLDFPLTVAISTICRQRHDGNNLSSTRRNQLTFNLGGKTFPQLHQKYTPTEMTKEYNRYKHVKYRKNTTSFKEICVKILTHGLTTMRDKGPQVLVSNTHLINVRRVSLIHP